GPSSPWLLDSSAWCSWSPWALPGREQVGVGSSPASLPESARAIVRPARKTTTAASMESKITLRLSFMRSFLWPSAGLSSLLSVRQARITEVLLWIALWMDGWWRRLALRRRWRLGEALGAAACASPAPQDDGVF